MTRQHAVLRDAAPTLAARLATADEIPGNADRLAASATLHGWSVRVTYAEGTKPPTTAAPDGRAVTSCAVRLRRGDVAAWALWIDGRFAGAATPLRPYTLTQLHSMIETR